LHHQERGKVGRHNQQTMSKPTPKQVAIIEAIRNEMDYWTTSNDIHSPSHGTSIDNDMFVNLPDEHELTPYQDARICQAIGKLHELIANIDPRKP
jgi:hypothetical protein